MKYVSIQSEKELSIFVDWYRQIFEDNPLSGYFDLPGDPKKYDIPILVKLHDSGKINGHQYPSITYDYKWEKLIVSHNYKEWYEKSIPAVALVDPDEYPELYL